MSSASKPTVKHLDTKVSELQTYFEDELSKFRTELAVTKSPEVTLDDGLNSIRNRFDLFENTIKNNIESIKREIGAVVERTQRLELSLDNNIQELSMSKLLLHGLSESEDKKHSLKARIVDLFQNKLNTPISEADVNFCYRLGAKKKTSDNTIRPVLICFHDIRTREGVFKSKKLFKGTKLAISEMLSPLRYKTFLAVKVKLGKEKCWTSGGRIGFRWNDRSHYVTTMDQLDAVCK